MIARKIRHLTTGSIMRFLVELINKPKINNKYLYITVN